MERPKFVLVLNAGIRPVRQPFVADSGTVRLFFMDISRLEDCDRLQGQVFDDVVWVRSLPWATRDREKIEFRIRSRIMRRENST